MPMHSIQPGDTVAALAELHGLFAETIWQHPRNDDLRSRRKRMDALAPGDQLFIPSLRDRQQELEIDRRHRFLRKGIPAKIRVQLRANGLPRAGESFRIEVAGQTVRGRTDADGVLEAFVPAQASEGVLHLGADASRPIRLLLGGMEADNTLGGVRKRLFNLSIRAPDGDDPTTPEWRLALLRFQQLAGLPPTMRLDDATSRALREGHDAVGAVPPASSGGSA